MFLPDAREEQLFESLAEIAVVIAYSHEAGLDDVGHNYLYLVRLSILIVWEKWKCSWTSQAAKPSDMENEEKCIYFLLFHKIL